MSVCTPPAGRAKLVGRLLDAWCPKVLVCEKPLEVSDAERRSVVARCAEARVPLIVNYTRRYEATYREARRAVETGRIGRVVSVSVRAPNRLWSIGSHAVNLLAYLAGENPSSPLVQHVPDLEEGGEPAANVLFRFPSGASGALITVGRKDVLLLEADVIGDAGRIVVSGNGEQTSLTPFDPSGAFVGYRVPGVTVQIAARDPSQSPFVAVVREAAAVARGEGKPSSRGEDALSTESIVETIVSICRTGARA